MTGPDVTSLRALAEAATPGPWQSRYERYAWELTKPCEISPGNFSHPLNILKANSGSHDWPPAPQDAAFIAAANPTAVLALLDNLAAAEWRADAAEADREEFRAIAEAARAEVAALRAKSPTVTWCLDCQTEATDQCCEEHRLTIRAAT